MEKDLELSSISRWYVLVSGITSFAGMALLLLGIHTKDWFIVLLGFILSAAVCAGNCSDLKSTIKHEKAIFWLPLVALFLLTTAFACLDNYKQGHIFIFLYPLAGAAVFCELDAILAAFGLGMQPATIVFTVLGYLLLEYFFLIACGRSLSTIWVTVTWAGGSIALYLLTWAARFFRGILPDDPI
jgi:hypothetical protein